MQQGRLWQVATTAKATTKVRTSFAFELRATSSARRRSCLYKRVSKYVYKSVCVVSEYKKQLIIVLTWLEAV